MNNEHQSMINPYVIEVFNIHENNVPYHVGTHFEKRVVRFYELELITGGKGRIITDGVACNVSKGDVFLRVPGTIVEGYSGYYFIVIAFDAVYDSSHRNLYATSTPYWVENRNEMLSDTGLFNDVPHKLKTFNYELESLFHTIFNEFIEKQQNEQLVLKARLLSILNLLFLSSESTIKNIKERSLKNNYDIIKSSQEYIDNNLDKDFSLSDLAKRCGISRNFYCRAFKSILGISPFDYIIRSRMSAAKKLLTSTNMKVSDISLMCGISDITYFYKLFKKHVNMTPVNFRERFSFTRRLKN